MSGIGMPPAAPSAFRPQSAAQCSKAPWTSNPLNHSSNGRPSSLPLCASPILPKPGGRAPTAPQLMLGRAPLLCVSSPFLLDSADGLDLLALGALLPVHGLTDGRKCPSSGRGSASQLTTLFSLPTSQLSSASLSPEPSTMMGASGSLATATVAFAAARLACFGRSRGEPTQGPIKGEPITRRAAVACS